MLSAPSETERLLPALWDGAMSSSDLPGVAPGRLQALRCAAVQRPGAARGPLEAWSDGVAAGASLDTDVWGDNGR